MCPEEEESNAQQPPKSIPKLAEQSAKSIEDDEAEDDRG